MDLLDGHFSQKILRKEILVFGFITAADANLQVHIPTKNIKNKIRGTTERTPSPPSRFPNHNKLNTCKCVFEHKQRVAFSFLMPH